MDIRKVKKLIELLEESNINELEITEGEESVRISRGAPVQAYAAPVPAAPTNCPPSKLPIAFNAASPSNGAITAVAVSSSEY